jgi:hypothetical protein
MPMLLLLLLLPPPPRCACVDALPVLACMAVSGDCAAGPCAAAAPTRCLCCLRCRSAPKRRTAALLLLLLLLPALWPSSCCGVADVRGVRCCAAAGASSSVPLPDRSDATPMLNEASRAGRSRTGPPSGGGAASTAAAAAAAAETSHGCGPRELLRSARGALPRAGCTMVSCWLLPLL